MNIISYSFNNISSNYKGSSWLIALGFEVVIFYYDNHNVNKRCILVKLKTVITVANNLKCCYDMNTVTMM